MQDSQSSPSITWKALVGKDKCKRRTTFRSDRPLQRLLREYVEEHKDELEVETAQRHARAGRGTSWPLPKTKWLRWLDRAQATYDKALWLAKVGALGCQRARDAASGCAAERSSYPRQAAY